MFSTDAVFSHQIFSVCGWLKPQMEDMDMERPLYTWYLLKKKKSVTHFEATSIKELDLLSR